MDPLLRFIKHQESSALCGARPEALPLDSTTFEKVDETFIRASCSGHISGENTRRRLWPSFIIHGRPR